MIIRWISSRISLREIGSRLSKKRLTKSRVFWNAPRSIGVEPLESRTLLSVTINPNTVHIPYGPPSIQSSESQSPGGPRGFPPTYDLRSSGLVTTVKNQGNCGACWTFATYGSLESSILRESGVTNDFSENNLKDNHGFDWGPCDGGTSTMSEAYLSRGSGPVSEANDPYHDWDDRPSPGGPSMYYVRDAFRFDTSDEIKNALMNYGAVDTSMYWGDAYYNSSANTYYYNGTVRYNHDITIVGWDDYKTVAGAPAAGAWLIKNSWGASWGNNGYFWLSYSDGTACKAGTSFCHAVSANTYNHVYYYDTFGDVSQLSPAYAFNAFTPTANDKLASVQFWTEADNANYTVSIYDNFSGTTLSTLLSTTSGTATYAGYHTIDLPTPLQLTAGDRFYVSLHITNGGEYPMAMDLASPGFTSNSTANPGESYYSTNGTSWTDLTTFNSTANFCIKALTIPATTPVTVAVSPASVVENGTTNLTYAFTRSGNTFGAMTVNFSLSGTADDATDYTVSGTGVTYNAATNTGTVVIPNGSATANVIVDPTGDSTQEPNETVIATITAGTGYTLGSPSSATGTILDDDTPTPPQTALTVGNVSIAGGTVFSFTVTYTDDVAVKYSTLDGGDVAVQRPNGSNLSATLVSVDKTTDAAVLTATYRITPPNGSWAIGDNGTYKVLMQANQVNDTYGFFVPAGTLGTFLVAIAAVPTNFGGASNTTNSITWSWSDNSNNESGFHGYDGSNALKWSASANQTTSTEPGLTTNTQYTRYVTVYTTAGEGGASNAASHYTSIEAATGPLFGAVTQSSIAVQSANVPSNLTAGNSGILIRNTVLGTDSLWHQNNTAWISAGLTANTPYSFTVQSRNGDGETTTASSSVLKWTLPATPAVSCDRSPGNPAYSEGTVFSFTNTAGWASGGVHNYKYVWDQSPTHTFTGSEPSWSSGILQVTPTATGRWYLHLLSQNGENVSGATADFGGYYILNAPTILSQVPGPGGTSSTIAWSGVSGAYRYYVECDNNADFSSPEQNSGWISATNYTFNGLTAGTKYYYRVKADMIVAPGSTGSWSQTSQSDFSGDSAANVSSSDVPGDVTLARGGTEVAGRIGNPSFENTTVWAGASHGAMYAAIGSSFSSGMPSNGSYCGILYTDGTALQTFTTSDYVGVSQNIDLTGIGSISFDYSARGTTNWLSRIRGEVLIDGVCLWYRDASGFVSGQTIDVSAYTGVHTLAILSLVRSAYTSSDSQLIAFDNFRTFRPSGYASAGTLVSTPIAPGTLAQWGVLSFDAGTPASTAITVDVLDAAGTLLAANVASGTDISMLGITAPSLRLRANLSTSNTSVTPALHGWTLGYKSSLDILGESEWSASHRTLTWDGGGSDNLWSTASNWVGDLAPTAGDHLVFPAGASRQNNVNDFPSSTIFGSITVLGGNYQITNGIMASGDVKVTTGSLAVASIDCDTLIIGAAPGYAASSIATVAIDSTSKFAQASPGESLSDSLPLYPVNATPAFPLATLDPSSIVSTPAIPFREAAVPIQERFLFKNAAATALFVLADKSAPSLMAKDESESIDRSIFSEANGSIAPSSVSPAIQAPSPRRSEPKVDTSFTQSSVPIAPAMSLVSSKYSAPGFANRFLGKFVEDAKMKSPVAGQEDGIILRTTDRFFAIHGDSAHDTALSALESIIEDYQNLHSADALDFENLPQNRFRGEAVQSVNLVEAALAEI